MSITKIINNNDRFLNVFTRNGRNKNKIIKRLERQGFSEFRERTLKDNSQVMLAYKAGNKLAESVYRFFPDLSRREKFIDKGHAFFSKEIKVHLISKNLRDKAGNILKSSKKKMRYENGVLVRKEEIINDWVKFSFIEKEENIKGKSISALKLNNIVKSCVKKDGKDMCGVYEQADGTKHCIMNINGVEHKFSSK